MKWNKRKIKWNLPISVKKPRIERSHKNQDLKKKKKKWKKRELIKMKKKTKNKTKERMKQNLLTSMKNPRLNEAARTET